MLSRLVNKSSHSLDSSALRRYETIGMLHPFNEGKSVPDLSLGVQLMMLAISTNEHVCVEVPD
jgi:hypothetical protein